MFEDDEWDSLTPNQQKAELARIRRKQKAVSAMIKKQMADMYAFVRQKPSAVFAVDLSSTLREGESDRVVLHIEVDANQYERFQAARLVKMARNV